MKTKRIVGLVICVVLAVGLILYMREKSTVLYAKSESEQWSACVMKAYGDPKETWDGFVFYRGKQETPKEVVLTVAMDGETIHERQPFELSDSANYSFEQKCVLPENYTGLYGFMSFCPERPKKVELTVQWQEGGKAQEEKLTL